MARSTKEEVLETPVVFGAGEDDVVETVHEDETPETETDDVQTPEPTPSEDTTSDGETENAGAGSDDAEDAEEGAVVAGPEQAPHLNPTTTVSPKTFDEEAEADTLPQFDTTTYAHRARHIANGDMIAEDGTSIVADKMVNAAKTLQVTKGVANSFPADGAAYLETLDFKVNA